MDSTVSRKSSRGRRRPTQSIASAAGGEIRKGVEQSKRWSRKGAYPTLFIRLAICLLCLSILSLPSAAAAAAAAGGSNQLLVPRQANNGAATTTTTTTAPTATDTTTPTQCGFTGDSDTYGKGIRVGLYLQWVTSSIAYNFVPEEAVTMRGVNNCFQAAMFAGLMYRTKTQGDKLYAVEAFILLLFCLGGVCSGNLYVTDERTGIQQIVSKGYANYEATTVGGFVRLFLGVAFCAYGLWFTFHGMDHMLHPPCSTFAFFLARVNLYNWYRTFLKVMFVFGAIPCAIFTIVGFFTMIIEFISFCCGGWRKYEMQQDEEEEEEKNYQKFNAANMGFGGGLIMFIIAVELTIKWNHIDGVSKVGSTGQLLPIIVSSLGVFRVLSRLFKNAV